MGGFHGGSHGGFHGGSHGGFHGGSHSSGGFHTSSHRSYIGPRTSFIYIGGGRHYSGGGNTGASRGAKKVSLVGPIIFAIIILFISIMVFGNMYYREVKAKIISVQEHIYSYYDSYETYTFEYEVGGNIYFGEGEDDINWGNYFNNYDLPTKVGEEYPLYVKLFDSTSYEFDGYDVKQDNITAIVFLIFGSVMSLIIVSSSISSYSKYKKRLSAIGDLNGDGKIDEKDLELYYQNQMNPKKDEEVKPKYKKCDYCDSMLDLNTKFCPNCGANLQNLDK